MNFKLLGRLFLGLALLSCACDVGEGERETLLVAGIYTTSLENPWAQTLHQTLRRSQEDLGMAYAWSENVSSTRFPEIVRDYVSRGYRVIVGDCFRAEVAAREVAREFPGILFCLGSELSPVPPNFSVVGAGLQEPAYLCGLMAARMSSSGKVGVVAAEACPSINRIVNAFRAGAARGRPDVEVLIEYSGRGDGAFSEGAGETVGRLRSRGADAVLAERPGAVAACAQSPAIPVFGCYADLSDLSPLNVISGAVWDPSPVLQASVEMARSGRLRPLVFSYLGTMALEGAFLAPYHGHEADLPAGLAGEIAALRDEILTGRFRVAVDESPPPLR